MDELHILLLFHANPQAVWSASELAKQLGIPPVAAALALAALTGRGLLSNAAEAGQYRWQMPSPELAPVIEALVALDRERPVTLIRMIYHGTGGMQAFADAFKIKKPKEE